MSPKTTTGKAIVRLNGVRHGMRTVLPVIKTESPAEWAEHRAGIIASLDPVGALEVVLAERVALCLWRLARVARFETAVIANAQAKAADDYSEGQALHRAYTRPAIEARAKAAGIELPPQGPTHPTDMKGDFEYWRSQAAFLEAFSSLPDDAMLDADDAGRILHPVIRVSGVNPRQVAVPGIPQGADLKSITDWRVGFLKECIAAIAAQADQDPAELLAKATEEAKREAHGARDTWRKAQTRVAMMEQERQLPDEDTLQAICRYEAHLSRELRHALHELEALQTVRQGGPAPLARVSITGSAEK